MRNTEMQDMGQYSAIAEPAAAAAAATQDTEPQPDDAEPALDADRGAPKRSTRTMLLIMAWDIGAPTGLYYGLRSAGVSVFTSLLAGAILPALSTAVQWLRNRHLDGLGTFGAAMMLMSLAASLISGSDRFLLARDGWVTGVGGLWFAATARARRPLVYQSARPLLEGRFRSDGTSWEVLWAREPRFRRIWRVATVMWGAMMLIDAAARITMAYTLPVDSVPALSSLLWPVTIVVLQLVTGAYYEIAGLWELTSGKPRRRGGRPARVG
jgi:hypothetical protein